MTSPQIVQCAGIVAPTAGTRSHAGGSARMMRVALLLLASAMLLVSGASDAVDLMEVWRAAQEHDLDLNAADSARKAGEARRGQASALWRPTVQVSGTAGRMNSSTETHGAQFSAPGFPQTDGVNFNTSVTNGSLGRWSIEARQPLLSGERNAQSRQLDLAGDLAEAEWTSARQSLMLSTALRYFDVAYASESLRVLQQQLAAAESALAEARDRHALGDTPVTGTYEAAARAEAIRAQLFAQETDLQLKQVALSDVTGLRPEAMRMALPGTTALPGDGRALDDWLADAIDRNPLLRSQLARVEVAREEAAKFSLAATTTVDLVAHAGQERLNGTGDFGSAGNNSRNAMIGVQVVVPLYTGGYRSARQEEALHLADKARAEAERARQQVALQTRTAWLGLTVGGGRIRALAAALQANVARLDATRLGLEVGDRSTLDLLNAQSDTANAELALLQARINTLMDRLRLAALAGKLDESQLHVVNATLRERPSP